MAGPAGPANPTFALLEFNQAQALAVHLADSDWNRVKNVELLLLNADADNTFISVRNIVDVRLKLGESAPVRELGPLGPPHAVVLANVKRGELDAGDSAYGVVATISLASNGADWDNTFVVQGSLFEDSVTIGRGNLAAPGTFPTLVNDGRHSLVVADLGAGDDLIDSTATRARTDIRGGGDDAFAAALGCVIAATQGATVNEAVFDGVALSGATLTIQAAAPPPALTLYDLYLGATQVGTQFARFVPDGGDLYTTSLLASVVTETQFDRVVLRSPTPFAASVIGGAGIELSEIGGLSGTSELGDRFLLGPGADILRYDADGDGGDVITGFAKGQDRIVVENFSAAPGIAFYDIVYLGEASTLILFAFNETLAEEIGSSVAMGGAPAAALHDLMIVQGVSDLVLGVDVLIQG